MEIAALRALRIAWKNKFKNSDAVTVHAESFYSDKHEEQWHYKILEATTIAMAAIIGGCDSLSLTPVPLSGKTEEFSSRIFRNIQLLLKHESFFDKVNDPAIGNFYIEKLTQQILQKVQKHYT